MLQEMTECLCGSLHCRKVIGMNNKSVKPTAKAGGAASTAAPGAHGVALEKRLLDPIGGKHPQGTKVRVLALCDCSDECLASAFKRLTLSTARMRSLDE